MLYRVIFTTEAHREDDWLGQCAELDPKGTAVYGSLAAKIDNPPPEGFARFEMFFTDPDRAEAAAHEIRWLDPELTVTVTAEETRDWLAESRKHFQPLACGERVWVSPPWHRLPEVPDGALELVIDPGLAFGTGQHPTTRLCLAAMEQLFDSRPADAGASGLRVLDLGTGSGILALYAALRGATEITAIDNDPLAVEAADQNFRLNLAIHRGLEEGQPLPDGLVISGTPIAEVAETGGPFDLIVANILLDPLVELAPLLSGLLAPGGRMILSGILAVQADELWQAYSGRLRSIAAPATEDWAALVLTT